MSRNENGVPSDIVNYQRSCHIVKRPDFEGYGFNLHSEKGKLGQYIGKVDENSPAEQAGLKQGDRIIEVNGVDIGKETHKQVVHRIKAISNEVRLLVIDPEKEKKLNNNNSKTVTPQSSIVQSTTAITTTPATTLTTEKTAATAATTTTAITAPTTPTKPTTPTNDIIKTISSQSAKDEIDNNGITSAQDICNNNKETIINTDNGHKDVQNGISSSTITTTSMLSSSSSSTSSSSTIMQKKTDTINVPTTPPQLPPQHIDRPTTPSTSEIANSTTITTTTTTTQQQPQKAMTTGLNLPMTAAEMRAKLLSKKKYDPKNDSVDVRKKFEIIKEL